MFRPQPQRPAETPRMDGMQEMLSTPAAYRAPVVAQEEHEEHDDAEEHEQEEEPVEELPAKTARGRRTPATRIGRKAPTPVPQSAPSKSTRAASQALEESEPEGKTARRTRARTADGAVGQVRVFKIEDSCSCFLTRSHRSRAQPGARLRRRLLVLNPRKTKMSPSLSQPAPAVVLAPRPTRLLLLPRTTRTQSRLPARRAQRPRPPQRPPRPAPHAAGHGPNQSKSTRKRTTTLSTPSLVSVPPATPASPPRVGVARAASRP